MHELLLILHFAPGPQRITNTMDFLSFCGCDAFPLISHRKIANCKYFVRKIQNLHQCHCRKKKIVEKAHIIAENELFAKIVGASFFLSSVVLEEVFVHLGRCFRVKSFSVRFRREVVVNLKNIILLPPITTFPTP